LLQIIVIVIRKFYNGGANQDFVIENSPDFRKKTWPSLARSVAEEMNMYNRRSHIKSAAQMP